MRNTQHTNQSTNCYETEHCGVQLVDKNQDWLKCDKITGTSHEQTRDCLRAHEKIRAKLRFQQILMPNTLFV